MRVLLTVASGRYEGRKTLVTPGQVFKIGRTAWADIAVPHDAHMSGLHFSIRCDQDHCYLKDLQSTNGTLVNGQATTETILQDGDVILAGRTQFRIQIELSAVGSTAVPDEVAPADLPAPKAPGTEADSEEKAPAGKLTGTVEDLPFVPPPPPLFAVDSGRPFDQALQDDDPVVRREALLAAAWTRQPWLLAYCRWQATQTKPLHWDAVWLLAVLGQPTDCNLIRQISRNEQIGLERIALLASFGHPRVVPDLLHLISSQDPETAVAAGSAFTKITGADIDSDVLVAILAEGSMPPSESEEPPSDEVVLPSLELAQQHWDEVKNEFSRGTRWRRGLNVSEGLNADLLAKLDMEGRWEALLRARYEGKWQGRPPDTSRIRRPLRFSRS